MKRDFPNVQGAEKYARDVVAGRIPACKWTVLACERHLKDRRREKSKDFPYRFDREKAERVARFIQLLPHIKGRWARRDPKKPTSHRLKLEGWQQFILCCTFGWVHKRSGKRRFRKASVYVPRKNGKSTTSAGVGWWMFVKDDEIGAEIYSGATTEKQAWEVFGPARLMGRHEPELTEGLGVTIGALSMFRESDGSKFEPLIGKPGDGSSPHCAIVDEYHEHPTAVLYDTMLTGMGAREQPLLWVISTAGDNLAGPCYDDWLTVQKILDGVIEDDAHFGIIFTMDQDDDWTSEVALRKANPNLGVSVSAEFLQSELRAAINSARKQGTFKTKHLNVWVNARDAFYNMERWHQSADPALKLEQFHGKRCFAGLDLASKVDIAALELVFPVDDQYVRFGRYYLPEETVHAPGNEHYRGWAADGWITVTEGNIIDFGRILEDIVELGKLVTFDSLGFDPFQATMLITELMNEGLPCVEVRAIVNNFSESMKQIDGLVRERKLKHNGDPVMAWMMSNVVARTDAKDNVYPRKDRPEMKIDGPVAQIIAFNRLLAAGATGRSFWER